MPAVLSNGATGTPVARELRVFVSSTFRDMHADREALVKRVFPPLRGAAAAAGVAWSEIDLRWGITEEQKLAGRVLEVCLREAARSRVFVLLLGERYGWVPAAVDLPADFGAHYPHLVGRGLSATEMEVRHVLHESDPARAVLVFLRAPAYRPPGVPADPEVESDRLGALKDDLRRRGARGELTLVEPYRDPDHLAELTAAALARLADRLFPGGPADPLAAEGEAHENAAARYRQVYVGRRAVFDRLDRATTPVVVTGPPGSGKTALVCNWAAHHIGRPAAGTPLLGRSAGWFRRLWRRTGPRAPRTWTFLHITAAGPHGGTWAVVVYRLLAALKAQFGIAPPVPDAPAALRSTLPTWLALAAAKCPLLLVLDGLDEMHTDPGEVGAWLPTVWPSGVRVILTAGPGPVLELLAARRYQTIALDPLTADEREAVATAYLDRFAKTLPPELLTLVRAAPALGDPFVLRTVLDEVRVFGIHEELSAYLGGWVRAAAAGAVVERAVDRLATDYDGPHLGLVRAALAHLAAARRGLTEGELRDLSGAGQLPDVAWVPFFAALRESLTGADGVWSFAHPQWAAVARAELAEPARRIADHFAARPADPRSLEELPWQLVRLADWTRLAALFADSAYLPAAWRRSPAEVRAYFAAWCAHADPSPLLATALAAAPGAHARAVAELFVSSGRAAAVAPLVERLVATTARHDPARPDAVGLLATIRLTAGDPAAAVRLLDEQFDLLPDGKPGPRAANLATRAALRDELGDPTAALALLAEAERLYAAAGDEIGLCDVIGNRAVALSRSGEVEAARRLLRELEGRCRVSGNLAGLQKALGNRAALEAARDVPTAQRLHAEEEALCRRLHDPAELYTSLMNQTRLLTGAADYDGAGAKAEEAVAIARALGQPAAEIDALLLHAEVYARAGIPGEASALRRAAAAVTARRGTDVTEPQKPRSG